MRLLVIFTGGTIGSSLSYGWISPDKSTANQLISNYQQVETDADTLFETISPYTILSENLSADELNKLISCIEEAQKKDYDGIIVTHGTDTLQYTAAALDYTLSKKIPVLLVSAAYPLQDGRSNGLDNFRAAVRFLKTRPQSGVYVSYQNAADRQTHIHLATRLLSHGETSADLHSLGAPYATVDNDKDSVTVNPICKLANSQSIGAIPFCKNSGVLVVESYPENVYQYDLDQYVVVLLSPYHSGTLNTASEHFQRFCFACKQKGIPVFVTGITSETAYDSSKAFADLGIIPLPFCTRIAIFVKCWLAQEKT